MDRVHGPPIFHLPRVFKELTGLCDSCSSVTEETIKRIETMVLPELNPIVAYTTHKTVNRLAREISLTVESCGARK